jgi:hypothetical protein
LILRQPADVPQLQKILCTWSFVLSKLRNANGLDHCSNTLIHCCSKSFNPFPTESYILLAERISASLPQHINLNMPKYTIPAQLLGVMIELAKESAAFDEVLKLGSQLGIPIAMAVPTASGGLWRDRFRGVAASMLSVGVTAGAGLANAGLTWSGRSAEQALEMASADVAVSLIDAFSSCS